jgi:hypothetical protein
MAFDADTHTEFDAPAARLALNTAILEAQGALRTVTLAQMRCRDFARAARGSAEVDEIFKIERELRALRDRWPAHLLRLETDLQRAKNDECAQATGAFHARLHEDGQLVTTGN